MNNAEILAVDSSVQTATSAKEKKPFTIFGVEFVHLYLLGIAIALIGWVAENAAKLISSGIIDSRFHLMPFISPYALIPFAFHILLGNPDNLTFFGKKMFQKETTKTKILSNLVSIVMICMFVFLGELVVGNLWEKLFGVQLWNYSTQKFHVTQYVSLLSTLGFGLGAYVIFKFFYRPALKFVQKKVSHKAAVVVCSTLGVAIVLDTICMGLQIAITGAAPVYWTFKVW
jgi:uncharacterized membrane protein